MLCKHEVTGSIPVGSTKLRLAPPTFGARGSASFLDLIGRFILVMNLPVRSRERDDKILTS